MAARTILKQNLPSSSRDYEVHPQRHVTFDLPERLPRNALWSFNPLVPARPGIGHIEDSTVNFASTLAYLDGDVGIPCSLLTRAGCSLRTWDSNGEPAVVTPEESGIDPALAMVLSSRERLQTAIDQLLYHGLLVTDNNGGALWMHPGTRAMYKQRLQDPSHWMVQAVLLVCHAFPRDGHLEVNFSDLARAYVAQLRHIIQHYEALEVVGNAPVTLKRTMASTLVASSHVASMAWKSEAVERAAKIAANLLVPDESLNMEILAREYDISRLKGPSTPVGLPSLSTDNKTLNARFGEVLLILSSHYLQNREDLKTATLLLQDILPVDRYHISSLEELILQKKAVAWGRICRFEGRFEEARQVLEAVYTAGPFPKGVVSITASSCDLVSHLAATLCELGDPVQAEMLISAKLDSVRSPHTRNGNAVLRLKLGLAEAVLQQGEYWRAQDIYWDLNRHFCIAQSQRQSILNTCRLNIGLARVQHVQGNWVAALKHWERALWVYDNHPESQGFGMVVVYASIAFVKNKMGDFHSAARYEAKARKLFEITGRRHWFAGLGTTWLDKVMPGLDMDAQETD